MLISLTNLAAMSKIQKNIWTKVRLAGLININTKDWQNKPPYMKVVYKDAFCFLWWLGLKCLARITVDQKRWATDLERTEWTL